MLQAPAPYRARRHVGRRRRGQSGTHARMPRPRSAGRARGADVDAAAPPLPGYARPRLGSAPAARPPLAPVPLAPSTTLALPQQPPPSTIAWIAAHRLCFLRSPGNASPRTPPQARLSSAGRSRPGSAGRCCPLPTALVAAAAPAPAAAPAAPPQPSGRCVAWCEDQLIVDDESGGGVVAPMGEDMSLPQCESLTSRSNEALANTEEYLDPIGVGDEVFSRYKSSFRWFPAVVERTWKEGLYKIRWADGDMEDRMKSRKDLQPKLDAERDHGDYAVGSYVLAQFRHGPWIAARVEKVQADGTFLLAWADRDPRDRVKHRSEMCQWRGPAPKMAKPPAVKVPVTPILKNPYKRLLRDAHRRADMAMDNLDAMGWYTPLYFIAGCEAWGG